MVIPAFIPSGICSKEEKKNKANKQTEKTVD